MMSWKQLQGSAGSYEADIRTEKRGLRSCHVAPSPTAKQTQNTTQNQIPNSFSSSPFSPTPFTTLMLSPLPSLHLLRLNSRLFILNSLSLQDLGKSYKMDQPAQNSEKEASDSNVSKRFSDEILPHILNLYASTATPRDFEIYAPDATFEDPLMCAHGVKQIKSSFYSLSKIFSESRIVEYSVKENVLSPEKQEVWIDNKQYYKFMGRGIDMISLIKLDIEGGKVVRHEDRWDKNPLRNRETVGLPLVGRGIEMVRRGSMFATHLLMGFGKDPTT